MNPETITALLALIGSCIGIYRVYKYSRVKDFEEYALAAFLWAIIFPLGLAFIGVIFGTLLGSLL